MTRRDEHQRSGPNRGAGNGTGPRKGRGWQATWFLALVITAGGGLDGGLAAQVPLTPVGVRDSLDRIRDLAGPLWQAGDPAGLALLDSAGVFLAEEPVVALVRGSPDLQTRILNYSFEVACARAIRADTTGALSAMRGMYEAGVPSDLAERLSQLCPPLYAFHEQAEYRDVLALWRSEGLRWSAASLATPYRDTLPAAERIAGLSLLWSNVKHVLPGFHTAPGLDLDSLYLRYLPTVSAPQSTLDYFNHLRRFVAQLGDAHSNVYAPDTLAARVYARPPIMTARIGGEVVVTEVGAQELVDAGIAPGDVITTIDGRAVDEYAAERVLPLTSSSTPQDLDIRAYGYQLLAGDEDRSVTLTIQDPRGRRRTLELSRSGYTPLPRPAANADTILSGNVGYLRLDDFASQGAAAYVEEAMQRLSGTDGLIIDVRRNGGGSSGPGYRLLTMLVDTAFQSNPSWIRVFDPLLRTRRALEPIPVHLPRDVLRPHPRLRYDKPVVVLAGGMTFSAAEDFVAAFSGLSRGVIIGQPTGGSTGQPYVFTLPGGLTARIRTKHDRLADGREFIGVGILPDIEVERTRDDIAQGRDPALARALEHVARRR